ncbi:endosialin isoform X1 [Alosa alosa]|uniref:endosialin isoform X1 n=1 Tax=Alosa alosa TaxID=278164 RepID=UPI002015328C|nr:endosialin isoform X1 [Alosa alosa]
MEKRRMHCPVCPCLLLLALVSTWCPLGTQSQELQEQDAICNDEGCYAVYFQRKTFRDSWRTCREKGGNLATVKKTEEAELIHELLSSTERRGPRVRMRLWIGLQRQPRQCSSTKPLRGFTWITGDQDTEYTNWQREDLPSTCAAPRCVVMTHNTADKTRSNRDNFKWLDGSCALAVDGFLCRFAYRGMCSVLDQEGGRPARYTTPFHLISTLLTHVPFGSMAILPCPEGTKEDQSVLCMLKDDGTVGWSRDAPLCSDGPKNWCEVENGGCAHLCLNTEDHYYCACSAGYELGEDSQSCQAMDACLGNQCEFQCELTATGHRCTCSNGYLLAPDGKSCLDIDECDRTPCPQVCVNAPGTFECRCLDGYQADENGECVDVDECREDSCEQVCVNTPGSFECQCTDGYTKVPEDPVRCQDIDECQNSDSCHQICRNYMGGFDCHCDEGYELEDDYYSCRPLPEDAEMTSTMMPSESPANTMGPETPDLSWSPRMPDWLTDPTPLEWLTELPNLEWLPTDLAWFTENPSEELSPTQAPHATHQEILTPSFDFEEALLDTPSQVAESDSIDSYGAPDDVSSRIREDVVLESEEAGDGARASLSPPRDAAEPAAGAEQRPEGGKRKHDKSWLLVALLVPLCVFIVVMLALGIVYCTSCAVEPRGKGTTDCYRWFTASKPAEASTAKSRA